MIVHQESQSLLLKIKEPKKITDYIQRHKVIDYQGHNLAVPHRLDVVRVLRNLGVNAPSPILYYYDWPHPIDKPPYEHQKITAAFMTLYPRAFCLNDPGTCKTAALLWAADYMMRIGQIRKVIIDAPLSTLDLVWKQEVFEFLMHRKVAVLHGSRAKRHDLLSRDFDFYVINHDALDIIDKDVRGRSDIDLIIVDECAEYRNASTDKYDTLCSVIGKRRLWMATGTPCPTAPSDAWAQARLVNTARVPTYFSEWKRSTMLQVTTHKWVPRVDSAAMAYEVLQPAIRFRKKDCLDLPPVTYTKRQVELTPAQRKAYTAMKNEMVMMGDGATITAVNAADRLNKLRQILLGAIKVPGTEKEYVEVPHQPRTSVLLECIRQAAAKVIVIVPFKGIIGPIVRDLNEQAEDQQTFNERVLAGHQYVEVINGDVSKVDRDRIIGRFKNQDYPRILLCHPRVMSHGLNLTEADMTVFYGPIDSNNDDQQVIERFNRPGQALPMTIVQMGSLPIEWAIYQRVGENKITQENILSLYKQEVLGIH